MTIYYPYQDSSQNIMILNDESKKTFQLLKKTGEVNLDFLSNLDGNSIEENIFSSLSKFSQSYIQSYAGPTLLFSLDDITSCFKFLHKIEKSSANVGFLMAVKSCKLKDSPIFTIAKENISGFDVSNEAEYNLLPDNLKNNLISVTGPIFPNSPQHFLNKNNAVCFTVESIEQYKQLQNSSQGYNYFVRLNTSMLLKNQSEPATENFRLSHFGINPDDIENLLIIHSRSSHQFIGFHMHSGFNMHAGKIGDGLPEGTLPDTYIKMARAALALSDRLKIKLKCLNLGGSMAYLNLNEFQALIDTIRKIVPNEIQILFEPGRFLTKKSGYALTKIEFVVERENYLDIIVDLSSQCHLRWANPQLIIPDTQSKETINIRIFGPTCTEIDHLGNFTIPATIKNIFQKGNVLLFSNISSYSASWNVDFNGIPAAQVNYF